VQQLEDAIQIALVVKLNLYTTALPVAANVNSGAEAVLQALFLFPH
jgi:hypothetical protein